MPNISQGLLYELRTAFFLNPQLIQYPVLRDWLNHNLRSPNPSKSVLLLSIRSRPIGEVGPNNESLLITDGRWRVPLHRPCLNSLHPTFSAECNSVNFRFSYPSCHTVADCLRTREIRRPCFPSCPARWCPWCRICTAIRGAGWLNPIYKGRPQAPPRALYRALRRQQSRRWWQCRLHRQPALAAWFRRRTLPLRFVLQSTTSRMLNPTSAWTTTEGYRRSDSVRGCQDSVWWPWHRPRRW